jgi:hypothetical protein
MTSKRDLSTKNGFTVVTYFPREASPEVVEAFLNKVAELAYSIERENWDPLTFGNAGDVLRVEEDEHHDCCPPHIYLSTSCFHGNHNYCQSERGLCGNKTPGVCKFCSTPCICKCHREIRTVDG